MTKCIRILLPFTALVCLFATASPAHAGQGTEQLIGAYNFLLEAAPRTATLQHGDFASFQTP